MYLEQLIQLNEVKFNWKPILVHLHWFRIDKGMDQLHFIDSKTSILWAMFQLTIKKKKKKKGKKEKW